MNDAKLDSGNKKKENKVKLGLEKNEQFIISWIFTYLLTVVFSILIIFNQFEDVMLTTNCFDNIFTFIIKSEYKFIFGYCKDLDAQTYLAAKLIETLIPTTLTFSGSMFVLQATKEKSNYLNACLSIVLFLIAMIGMFYMVSKHKTVLIMYMWVLVMLFVMAVFLSSKVYDSKKKEQIPHKKEPDDGNIIG